MNLKIEVLKACIFILIGAFLCNRYAPKPEQPKIEAKQEQQQVCKTVIKKHTNKDGSVDEFAEFIASNSQTQTVTAQTKKPKLNGLGAFENELLLKRKILQDVNLFGLEFDLGIMAKATKDDQKLGVILEW